MRRSPEGNRKWTGAITSQIDDPRFCQRAMASPTMCGLCFLLRTHFPSTVAKRARTRLDVDRNGAQLANRMLKASFPQHCHLKAPGLKGARSARRAFATCGQCSHSTNMVSRAWPFGRGGSRWRLPGSCQNKSVNGSSSCGTPQISSIHADGPAAAPLRAWRTLLNHFCLLSLAGVQCSGRFGLASASGGAAIFNLSRSRPPPYVH